MDEPCIKRLLPRKWGVANALGDQSSLMSDVLVPPGVALIGIPTAQALFSKKEGHLWELT